MNKRVSFTKSEGKFAKAGGNVLKQRK